VCWNSREWSLLCSDKRTSEGNELCQRWCTLQPSEHHRAGWEWMEGGGGRSEQFSRSSLSTSPPPRPWEREVSRFLVSPRQRRVDLLWLVWGFDGNGPWVVSGLEQRIPSSCFSLCHRDASIPSGDSEWHAPPHTPPQRDMRWEAPSCCVRVPSELCGLCGCGRLSVWLVWMGWCLLHVLFGV
jgi:hypothetical protein